MNQWKITAVDNDRVFEHATWEKNNLSFRIIKVYQNINCVLLSNEQPLLIQDKGPFGQSANILLENYQSISLLNQSTFSLMFGDIENDSFKSTVEQVYSNGQDQNLIDNGFNRVKHEIWLNGPILYEKI